jgi:hypothetical protein
MRAATIARVRRIARWVLLLAVVAAGAIAVACGAGGFEPQSKVTSVRIFGVRADKPFAKPGETVTLEVLAADGRRDKPRPMKIFWIPIVCINPREDLYYLCFLPSRTPDGGQVDGGARLEPPFPIDAGADFGGGAGTGLSGDLASIPQSIDLSPFLPQGTTFSFRMPDDVIRERPGTPPYGLAIVFNMACAGQVRIFPREGAGLQQIPLRCTDEEGNPLGPEDYVIGINRVYSYLDRENTNPVVEKVTLDGGDVDPARGITVPRCVAKRRADCKPVLIDVKVPESSWEENPPFAGQAPQREQIWVTYYSDIGDLRDDARLLYDARQGRIDKSDVEFRPPYEPGEGTIWAVVHDNRVGAAFVTFPVHVK